MPIKNYSKTGSTCRVTFKLPPNVEAQSVCLVGDFNDWAEEAQPRKRLKDGSFSVTISLPTGQSYRYRFLIDGSRWENDWEADGYVPNVFCCEDSVVDL